MSPHLLAALRSVLMPQEAVLWSQSPRPLRMARMNLSLAIFGVVWTGFFVVAAMASIDAMGVGGLLCLSPFLLCGVGFLSSPAFGAMRASRTLYAITDRRAIVVEKGLLAEASIRSFEGVQIRLPRIVLHKNGSGDIVLQERIIRHGDETHVHEVGFYGIESVLEIQALLAEVASGLRSTYRS